MAGLLFGTSLENNFKSSSFPPQNHYIGRLIAGPVYQVSPVLAFGPYSSEISVELWLPTTPKEAAKA